MLEANSIFNESLYITLNPDVAEAKLRGLFNSGFDHFTQFGKFEKRSPSAYFDPSFYLAKNWDVAKAVEAGTMSSAFDHFRLFGQKENRDTSILFQNSYYLAHQSDVAAAVERDELTGIEHFVTFGIDEGRPSSPAFDVRYYLEHYPDLQAAGFGYREAIEHFFVYGLSEGRTSSPTFDVRYYLGHYPDLQAAGFNYQQAFQHFLVYGLQEGRQGCQPLPYGQDGLVVRDVVTGNPEFINPPSSFNQNEQQETTVTTGANSNNAASQPDSTDTLPLTITTPSDEIDNLVIPSDDSNDVIDETDNLGIPSDDSNDSSTQLTPTVTLPKTLMGLEKEPTTLPLDLPPNAGGANSHKNPAPKHLQFSTTEEEYYKNTSVRLKDAWVFDASGASDLDKVVFSLHKVGDKSEDKEDKNGAVGKEDKEDKENKNSTVGKEDKEDKDKQDQVGKQDKEDKENKNGAVGKEDKEDKEDNKDNQDKVGKEDNKDNQDEGEVDKESSKDDEATLPLQNMTVFNTYSKDDRWGWFNYSLSGLAPGKYQLKGVAYDKDGGKSNTAVAHFTVSDKELPMPLIGVIDTGFSANNPDIDYSRVTLGKDLVDGDDNPLLQAGEGNEHGTHILGIIAATQNNGVGIYGMNDEAPLWLGRAIGSGKWAESLMEFVDAAKASGKKALVNLSLDMTQVNPDGSVTTRYEFTPKEREALEYARQNGVLIVAAAGNDGDVMSVLGQASQEFDNIITVGAANGNQRADYSSFGYGLDIVTEGGTIENPIVSTVGDDVGTMAGTSVAAAQVTGAASLVWEANPGLNYRQVIEVLKSNATDLNTVGWDKETGAGFLNVDKAVEAAKAIAPVAYAPEAFLTPTTWGGEGKVTAMERAAADEYNGKYYDWVSYTVQSGDTLSQIALDTMGNGTAPYYNFIAQHNGISDPNRIYAGQVIEIPTEVSAPSTGSDTTTGTTGNSTNYVDLIALNRQLNPWLGDSTTDIIDLGNNSYKQTFTYGAITIWIYDNGSGSTVDDYRNTSDSSTGSTDNSSSNNSGDNNYSGSNSGGSDSNVPPPSITINGYTIDGSFYPVFQNYQGALGNPTSGITNYSSGVSYQQFENGSIVSSANGTFPLYGGIGQRYLKTGGLSGWLGAPKSGEIGLGNGNIIQYFENGHIYWNGRTATAYREGSGVPSAIVPVNKPKKIDFSRTGSGSSGFSNISQDNPYSGLNGGNTDSGLISVLSAMEEIFATTEKGAKFLFGGEINLPPISLKNRLPEAWFFLPSGVALNFDDFKLTRKITVLPTGKVNPFVYSKEGIKAVIEPDIFKIEQEFNRAITSSELQLVEAKRQLNNTLISTNVEVNLKAEDLAISQTYGEQVKVELKPQLPNRFTLTLTSKNSNNIGPSFKAETEVGYELTGQLIIDPPNARVPQLWEDPFVIAAAALAAPSVGAAAGKVLAGAGAGLSQFGSAVGQTLDKAVPKLIGLP